MALKRIVQLNEGPLDFIRGAARQVAPAVRQTVASGQRASAVADLTKAVTALVQMLQAAQQSQAQTQAQAQRPNYNAATPQQNVSVAGTSSTAPARPRMTFASYIPTTYGEQLDEGVMDFVRGAAGTLVDKGKQAINRYAEGPSLLKDVVMGGVARHRQGVAQRESQKIQNQIKLIQQILQRLQNPQNALRQILGKVAGRGDIANQIYSMMFPSAQPAQQPAQQPTQRPGVKAQWSQGAAPTAAPAVQPRTRGPGNRRSRPTPTQP